MHNESPCGVVQFTDGVKLLHQLVVDRDQRIVEKRHR